MYFTSVRTMLSKTGGAHREGGVRCGHEEGKAPVFRGQGQRSRRQSGVSLLYAHVHLRYSLYSLLYIYGAFSLLFLSDMTRDRRSKAQQHRQYSAYLLSLWQMELVSSGI